MILLFYINIEQKKEKIIKQVNFTIKEREKNINKKNETNLYFIPIDYFNIYSNFRGCLIGVCACRYCYIS